MSDAERADLLTDYFGSVCTTNNDATPTVECLLPTGVDIESVEFTPGKVHAAMKKLKVGDASGPDGFPPLLCTKTTYGIDGPLSLIFSSFMSVGKKPRVVTCNSHNGTSTKADPLLVSPIIGLYH